jgi:hypothetical protein
MRPTPVRPFESLRVAPSKVEGRRAHPRPQISAEFEDYRDERWCREGTRTVCTVLEAERFVEQVGFAACMTDSRRPGPSLYVAVCGRRDAVLPRNVQKDPESSLTWNLKDQLVRRGKVYYAKLARGKAMLVAPRMVPHFHAIWGMRRAEEAKRLSRNARAVLRVLRKEWEMATSDLRIESGVADRVACTRAIDELQAAMIVVPQRSRLSAEVHVPVDARRRSVSRRVEAARESSDRSPRDRARLSGRSGHDDSRRARPRHRPLASGCGARQPRARRGRVRDDARAGDVSAGARS